ncbi:MULTISPECIES: MFS transporter [unclassified Leucobacter]|uniref:MFS transporter n=1 Tax=unclassified Leucobacter TaxID=2621730 RepID=UPI00165DADC4|nr:MULTISPECIES: MFS transporter [unclassified Leucobacter]MBC9936078.1 MFS transporter [Leucobacter sp. cx-87]
MSASAPTQSAPLTQPLLVPGPAWRRWMALAVLMLPVLLIAIDNTVLGFALPQISLDFGADGTMLLWIVDAYPLVLAGLLVTMGSLSDRFGRRRLLLLGGIGFTAVSVSVIFVESAAGLIAVRALLGVFGAMLMPAVLSLIRNLFTDRNERRTALAIFAGGFSSGAALGPVLGGVLLESFHWHSVFLLAIPVLVPMLILMPIFVPESRDPNPGPISFPDMFLSIAALGPAVLAIKTIGSHGFTPTVFISAAISIIAGLWFARRQLTREHPLLDLRLFTNAPFAGSVAANLLAVFSLTGFLYFASQYLQLALGIRPLIAGLVLLPGTVVMVLAGLAAVRIVRRIPVNRVMASGLVLSSLGYLILTLVGDRASALSIAVAFFVMAIGIGAAETLSNDAIISAVPAARAGSASAISETAYEVGAVLGTAVLGSIITASYRGAIELPAGLSAEQQALAGETLGGAVNVATNLPAGLADELMVAANHAFASGVTLTSTIGAIVVALSAVLTLIALRTPAQVARGQRDRRMRATSTAE